MSSPISTPLYQSLAGNIYNADGTTPIYAGGAWALKNASGTTVFTVSDAGAWTIGMPPPSGANTQGALGHYIEVGNVATIPKNLSTAWGFYLSGNSLSNDTIAHYRTADFWNYCRTDSPNEGGFSFNTVTSAGAKRTVGYINQLGAWEVGPSGQTAQHAANGRFTSTWNDSSAATSGSLDTYRKTSTATHYLSAFYSDVGSTGALKWRVEADGDTISSTGSYTSDVRAKKNLAPIPYGLAEIMKLSPKSFNWWHEEDSDTKSFCISTAQEVQAVMPEMVRDDGIDGPNGEKMKAIYDKEVMAVMVKAIQEQQTLIQNQAQSIEQLKSRIEALESK